MCLSPSLHVLVGSVHRMDSACNRVARAELCPPKWARHKSHLRLWIRVECEAIGMGGRLSVSFFLLWGKERGGINLQRHVYAVGSETEEIKVRGLLPSRVRTRETREGRRIEAFFLRVSSSAFCHRRRDPVLIPSSPTGCDTLGRVKGLCNRAV